MKTARTILFCLLLSFTYLHSNAEQRIIRGTVTEVGTGEKLTGVNVVETNENDRAINGTTTNRNGEFILEIQLGTQTVIFSYIGYKSQTVNIGNRSNIKVELEEETDGLEEVVVLGEKKQTTGDINDE
jgi:iron complex outermembrane receptor protein